MNDTQLLKEMGERIYCRRKHLGLTQEELAEKVGVSIQMISNLELGKKAIRPENLVKISSVLNISTDYILKGIEFENEINLLVKKMINLPSDKLNIVKDVVNLCINQTDK